MPNEKRDLYIFKNNKYIKAVDSEASGLEVIEWDGERTFTDEEVEKLAQLKACVKIGNEVYYVYLIDGDSITDYDMYLIFTSGGDDGISGITYDIINIYNGGQSADTYHYNFGELKDIKLYHHQILFSNNDELYIQLPSSTPLTISTLSTAVSYGANVGTYYNDVEGTVGVVLGTNLAYDYSTIGIWHWENSEGAPVVVGELQIVSDTVTEI